MGVDSDAQRLVLVALFCATLRRVYFCVQICALHGSDVVEELFCGDVVVDEGLDGAQIGAT